MADAVHPLASVTVAVYVVVAAGITVCAFPAKFPGVHTTFSAGVPPAGVELRFALDPAHKAFGAALAVIVTSVGSVTIAVTVEVHPLASDTTSVYVPPGKL